MQVSTILDQIDNGDIALPEFQRGYVWNREQVRGLFTSLYRGYPVGGFMTWTTPAGSASSRADSARSDGNVRLLLDGQQRATSLYGVIRGHKPPFFEGRGDAFSGLHFNVEDELFEFYAPVKMGDNPLWVDVTAVMQDLGPFIAKMHVVAPEKLTTYLERLQRVNNIRNREVHIDEVTGADKTIDVVVDIFNRVNSGGTKLSKGDLALAKVCAVWPEARSRMNEMRDRWAQNGFHFSLDWVLRNVNAIVTGEARFIALAEVPIERFQEGLVEAENHINHLLDMVGSYLGIDHDRVLMGRYAFPIMCRYLHNVNKRNLSPAERGRLLRWYIHAGMWGRFAGSTETVLNQDLSAVDETGLDGLEANLTRWRGDLRVRPSDFEGYSVGARFYPVLYLMTRTQNARDFGDGIVLSKGLLGRNSALEVHHIFPRALLYRHGYDRAEVNAVANFCFLTKGTNISISDRDPAEYFDAVEATAPGALQSQWIPLEPELRLVENYRDFLARRRELLAASINDFLDELSHEVPEELTPSGAAHFEAEADPRSAELAQLFADLEHEGFAPPEADVEVTHPETGELLAVAEAFWPRGLQEGLGDPVVLELDPEAAELEGLSVLGYKVFTTIGSLREYVERMELPEENAERD